MGLRINTNVSSLISQRHLERNHNSLAQNFERMSSGLRINKSSDDAAGLAVSESIRAKVRGFNQARRNANDAISMVQIAEGGMNELGNMLIRLRELTVQSASDTLGETERGFLNREYVQLVDEVDRIVGTTEFNGLKLFKSEDVNDFVIQVGVNGTEPEENLDTISINLDGLKFSSEDLELGKGAEIGPENDDPTGGPDRETIASRLVNIDNALTRMASERATLGSVQSRLQSAINNLSISTENQETARSRIIDTDFAAETATMTQNRILTQAGLSVLSQANLAPEMALTLLR